MTQEYIAPLVREALVKIGAAENTTLFFEIPKVADHGDLSTNVAMTLARELKKAPRKIAEELLENISADQDYISAVEIAGAGFINFRFTPKFYSDALVRILAEGDSLGRNSSGRRLKTNVEYVSANPTGPLHLGHGRNAAIGDTVANLLDWNGYDVTREYYYNNAGNQMNLLGRSIYARYRQALGEEEYPFPEDGYHGETIRDIAAELKQDFSDSLTAETDENLQKIKKFGEEYYTKLQRGTLASMNISHDIYFNEDSLYTDGKVSGTVDALREKGLVYEKDGATWFELTKLGQEKDKVIIKSSGEPTYRLPDIAYHKNKLDRGFELVVDVFGADHIATIPDVIAGVKALGYDENRIKVLIYQFVTLTENGEQVKMSKRSGKSYTLDQLIEEVGADVVRFFFVMRGITTHLEFDLALAREQSDKNPVFYLQYAHARICSIFHKIAEQNITISESFDSSLLEHPAEQNLIKTLLRFPATVQKAGQNYEPQIVAEYLREVAAAFHTFYHECRILGSEEGLLQARLHLAKCARTVLKNGLTILGINAPERM